MEFKTSDFNAKENMVGDIGSMINHFQNKFREMSCVSNATDMVFSLEDGNFENCVT